LPTCTNTDFSSNLICKGAVNTNKTQNFSELLSDGDVFKSFIKKNETLPIYVSQVCRSATLQYEKEVTVQGIGAYRYLLPTTEFDYSLPDNCGFCIPATFSKYGAYDRPVNSTCLPSGLLDLTGCQGIPIIISKPHFYQAADIVRSFVPRFKPTYENDETTLDIEPTTGTVVAAQKRLQLNMLLNQFTTIGAYSVLRPGAYPLVWFNESYIMDNGTRDDFNSSLFKPKKIIEIICWCAIGVGSFLIVLSAILCIVTMYYMGEKDEDKRD
ncbi:CD36 family protein, partial [Cooperia oncophora]